MANNTKEMLQLVRQQLATLRNEILVSKNDQELIGKVKIANILLRKFANVHKSIRGEYRTWDRLAVDEGKSWIAARLNGGIGSSAVPESVIQKFESMVSMRKPRQSLQRTGEKARQQQRRRRQSDETAQRAMFWSSGAPPTVSNLRRRRKQMQQANRDAHRGSPTAQEPEESTESSSSEVTQEELAEYFMSRGNGKKSKRRRSSEGSAQKKKKRAEKQQKSTKKKKKDAQKKKKKKKKAGSAQNNQPWAVQKRAPLRLNWKNA